MKNDSIRVTGQSCRAWPRTARSAAAIIATVGLALLPMACGASPLSIRTGGPPDAGGSTISPSAIGFSHCMRSHGVPNFPDPTSGGAVPKVSVQQLGVSSSRFQAAQRACQQLLPAGTDDMFPPGEVQQLLIGMVRFSKCMRSHAVPNWPDPTIDSEGRPVFLLSAHGFTRQQARSSRITHAMDKCQHLLPPALGGTPIG